MRLVAELHWCMLLYTVVLFMFQNVFSDRNAFTLQLYKKWFLRFFQFGTDRRLIASVVCLHIHYYLAQVSPEIP